MIRKPGKYISGNVSKCDGGIVPVRGKAGFIRVGTSGRLFLRKVVTSDVFCKQVIRAFSVPAEGKSLFASFITPVYTVSYIYIVANGEKNVIIPYV
jgi:hypothetical protein